MTRPPIVGITHPLILKDGELFFVCDREGRVEPAGASGHGLFFRDCRFLCRYEWRIGEERPALLMSSATEGFVARFEFTNPPLAIDGSRLREHALTITRRQTLHAAWNAIRDHLALRNCTLDAVAVELRLRLEARFEDIFAVRGARPKQRGELAVPSAHADKVEFRYRGADGVTRRLEADCVPAPLRSRIDDGGVELSFSLALEPQQSAEIDIILSIAEGATEGHAPPASRPSRPEAADQEGELARRWLAGYAQIACDDPRVEAAIRRSLSDIRLLTIERENGCFIAAGVPWFVALFGRDSLVPSLQCLAYRPELAAHTLRLLARWQGRSYASGQKEQPGKILHELRIGEMARLGEAAQHPGYGSVDATLLFLIVLARHAEWTGSTALFEELRHSVERALDWMDRDGDADCDGYIEYDSGVEGAPANQAWKDSADAISRPDGSLVRGRIALVEVQAYAELAWRLIGGLYARLGDSAAADRLAAKADALRDRFNRDFWMDDQGCYCLALDQDGRQVGVISSNPGQALWAGIAEPDKARRVAERLMAPDMFSGWGVRTLSERSRRYNPIGYHTGSVWPFDNALIAAGFLRCGYDDLAERIFAAQLAAAGHFEACRLPEFFSGLARRGAAGPARCPRADPLQAWSSGALPFMMTSFLGLEPDGFARRLRVRPRLPRGLNRLDLTALRVGEATADLVFERRGDRIEVSVGDCDGHLEIET